MWCPALERLPAAIGNAMSQQEKDVRECEHKVEVPAEVGNFDLLDEVGQISYLSWDLQLVTKVGCNGPAEDVELGLTSLTRLHSQNCKKLNKVPSTASHSLIGFILMAMRT
eukprot:c13887_g1_i2 orf=293-625(+)